MLKDASAIIGAGMVWGVYLDVAPTGDIGAAAIVPLVVSIASLVMSKDVVLLAAASFNFCGMYAPLWSNYLSAATCALMGHVVGFGMSSHIELYHCFVDTPGTHTSEAIG